ncbi:MAG: N-acetylneuraminate synthase family protein [Thermoleophilaceae bacterium]
MKIGDFDLDERVLVVAEIGNNHEGDAETARELVREAAAAGAHAVKFQTFKTELFVSALDAARFAQLSRFELPSEVFAELADLARSLGLLFLSTPLDLESAGFLEGIVDAMKIASGDNDFFPLLRRVAAGDKPIVISTGASEEGHVQAAVDAVTEVRGPAARDSVALLHCVSSYPAEPQDLNLRAIPYLAERFPYAVGYSDHSLGITAALAAVALGARIVEKHFTLESVSSDFRDHQLSATPSQMRELVDAIEQAQGMLGSFEKTIQPTEAEARDGIHRSIVAARDLQPGHKIREDDLTWVRPGGGLAPGQEACLLGYRLRTRKHSGEQLLVSDLE